MKTIKSFLIAATLICATVASSVSAQQKAQPAQEHQWKVAIGDSVMIKRECQQYLTGERPSVWVWDKVHTVRQLGTKRFPEGVLLMNIYSWICEDCLVVVSGHSQEAAEEAAEKQAEEKKAFEQEKKEPKPVKEEPKPVKEEPKPVKEEPKPVQEESKPVQEEPKPVQEESKPVQEEPKPAEEVVPVPVVVPVEEQPAQEQQPAQEEQPAKEEQPAQEETPPAQPQPQTQQAPQGDTIRTKQNFGGKYDRFTIGLRGGASALMHHATEGNWTCGGDVILDLQYAHYWTKDGRPVDLGLIVGLGVGYQQSGLRKDSDQTSFNKGTFDYTVLVKNVKETDHQLQLEVPLMFSLIHQNGLFFNVGPKFMIPVYTPYNQSVDVNNTHISAYDHQTGVTVQDEVVTGKYTGQQPEGKNGIQFNVNVMLTAEIGYEWILKSGNSLGLGAYANYSVYNSFKNNNTSTEGLFNLTAPTESSAAILDVKSATQTYADKLGYFDAGVKIAYHFNFPKKRKNIDSRLF